MGNKLIILCLILFGNVVLGEELDDEDIVVVEGNYQLSKYLFLSMVNVWMISRIDSFIKIGITLSVHSFQLNTSNITNNFN